MGGLHSAKIILYSVDFEEIEYLQHRDRWEEAGRVLAEAATRIEHIKKAIDDMDWSNHAARYLVLVTDAGPRSAGDPLSSTGLDAEALRALARESPLCLPPSTGRWRSARPG